MTEAGVLFNPLEPGFFDDPYGQYAQLRELDPVHESPLGVWVLFRYDDCYRLLRDASLSVEDRHAAPTARTALFQEQLQEREERGSRAILNIDPPDHDRLRKLVSKAFTPRMIDGLRPLVQHLVDDALDAVAARGDGAMDVVGDLAFPLPFAVINRMLGMPETDADRLRGWSHAIVKTLDPIISPEDIKAAIEASDLIVGHVDEVIEWKRREPAGDLLSALIAAEDQGDVLTTEELRDQVVLLYIAGHETTVNLIGNGTLALLRHRDQLERLQSDPALAAPATDELLRYDSPVQVSRRITLRDVEIGDRTIPAGTFVLTSLGSANRDPAKWGETAADLDLGRHGAAQHLSFGSGVHYCLGAALARLEGQVAIGTLVRRFPNLEMVEDAPAWNGRIVLRGLDRLPVALG